MNPKAEPIIPPIKPEMQKGKVGRKPYKPTQAQRAQVESMAAYGVPEHAIALVIGCDPKTLRKYYREELDTAHIKATSQVAQSLFQKAIGSGSQSVTAAIFWMKTRAGWRETPTAVEVSGPNGEAIPMEFTIVLDNASAAIDDSI